MNRNWREKQSKHVKNMTLNKWKSDSTKQFRTATILRSRDQVIIVQHMWQGEANQPTRSEVPVLHYNKSSSDPRPRLHRHQQGPSDRDYTGISRGRVTETTPASAGAEWPRLHRHQQGPSNRDYTGISRSRVTETTPASAGAEWQRLHRHQQTINCVIHVSFFSHRLISLPANNR
jgi:hypothetical protein